MARTQRGRLRERKSKKSQTHFLILAESNSNIFKVLDTPERNSSFSSLYH